MIIDLSSGRRVRPLRLGDQHWLHRAVQDPEVSYWLLGMPDPYFPEHAHRYVNDPTKPESEYRLGIFVDDEGVGGIQLKSSRSDSSKVILGYWIKRCKWGTGLAYDAVSAFLNVVNKKHPGATIHATVEPGNEPFIKLLQRLNFKENGTVPCTPIHRRAGEMLELLRFEFSLND